MAPPQGTDGLIDTCGRVRAFGHQLLCLSFRHGPHEEVGGGAGSMQLEGDEPGQQVGDRMTVAEIHDSIATISEADMARLV